MPVQAHAHLPPPARLINRELPVGVSSSRLTWRISGATLAQQLRHFRDGGTNAAGLRYADRLDFAREISFVEQVGDPRILSVENHSSRLRNAHFAACTCGTTD